MNIGTVGFEVPFQLVGASEIIIGLPRFRGICTCSISSAMPVRTPLYAPTSDLIPFLFILATVHILSR